MDTKDCLRGSYTQHAPSAKVAWAFVLKSKDYGLEYEKEFPPCPAPTNLKTYRRLEALKCLHKAHMPGNLRYCKTTNKSCPRGLPMGRNILEQKG